MKNTNTKNTKFVTPIAGFMFLILGLGSVNADTLRRTCELIKENEKDESTLIAEVDTDKKTIQFAIVDDHGPVLLAASGILGVGNEVAISKSTGELEKFKIQLKSGQPLSVDFRGLTLETLDSTSAIFGTYDLKCGDQENKISLARTTELSCLVTGYTSIEQYFESQFLLFKKQTTEAMVLGQLQAYRAISATDTGKLLKSFCEKSRAALKQK
jgi:hypothetical protein